MTAIEVLFAGVAVTDFDAAMAWYGRFMGRPADIDVNQGEAMWHVADAGWIYVLADGERAGHGLVTLSVANLDRSVADIRSRGISVVSVEAVGEAGRKASIIDPDGNHLDLIEVVAVEIRVGLSLNW